jgi:hypothetical protein
MNDAFDSHPHGSGQAGHPKADGTVDVRGWTQGRTISLEESKKRNSEAIDNVSRL